MSNAAQSASGGLFLIEQAGWRDFNAVRQIEKACFPKDAWSLWDIVGVLSFPNVVRLKAVVDSQVVGFVAGDPRPSEKLAWIATVGVLPEYRSKGIATALIGAVEEKLKAPRVRLCVRVSNEAAIRLYGRLNYQRLEVWKGYYSDREDALVMEKVL